MKTINKTALSAAVVLAFTLGTGYVIADETDNLGATIAAQMQFGESNISVTIIDRVATLIGYVEAETERRQAESIALNAEGVDKVINQITTK